MLKNIMELFELELSNRTTKYRQVFEQSEGICALCKKMVDPTLPHPHPKAGTIDHIIPLVEGGTGVMTNLQLAHHICNMGKGASYKGASSKEKKIFIRTHFRGIDDYSCGCGKKHKPGCWYPSYV